MCKKQQTIAYSIKKEKKKVSPQSVREGDTTSRIQILTEESENSVHGRRPYPYPELKLILEVKINMRVEAGVGSALQAFPVSNMDPGEVIPDYISQGPLEKSVNYLREELQGERISQLNFVV